MDFPLMINRSGEIKKWQIGLKSALTYLSSRTKSTRKADQVKVKHENLDVDFREYVEPEYK
jgi:hypothetical protein